MTINEKIKLIHVTEGLKQTESAKIKNTDEFIYIGTVLFITNITITCQKQNDTQKR